MGTRTRTRPDESRKPGKITAEGYRALQEQAARLWSQRSGLADAVATAAAEGDRSENAEYTYSKQKLAALDRKLRFLGNRLEVLTVMESPPPRDGKVHFGCWVDAEDEEGELRRYRLVGSDEMDVERGWVSSDSPVGVALMGKRIDDEVLVKRPKGDLFLTVVEIHVTEPEPLP